MSDQSSAPSIPAEPQHEPAGKPVFAPYDAPAGGRGALHATARALREQSDEIRGTRALLSMNQPEGFDCPGCAWPDPRPRDARFLRSPHRPPAATAKRLLAGAAGPLDGANAL